MLTEVVKYLPLEGLIVCSSTVQVKIKPPFYSNIMYYSNLS